MSITVRGRLLLSRQLLFLSLTGLLLGIFIIVRADSEGFEEYQVKAVFLFNFTHFVTWPANAFPEADGPFRICVLGHNNPFGNLLEKAVRGETVEKHRVETRHIRDAWQARHCHIVFLEHRESDRQPALLRHIKDRPVLTVGETPNFIERGGMIGFVWREKKLKFAINLKAARAAGLRIDYKLLKLATEVVRDE